MSDSEDLIKRGTEIVGTDPVVVATDRSAKTSVSVQVFHAPPNDDGGVTSTAVAKSQPGGTIVMGQPDPYLAVKFTRAGVGRAPIPFEYEIRLQGADLPRGNKQ